jgi:hypothetical protein
MAGCRHASNEPSGSIKVDNFLTIWVTVSFSWTLFDGAGYKMSSLYPTKESKRAVWHESYLSLNSNRNLPLTSAADSPRRYDSHLLQSKMPLSVSLCTETNNKVAPYHFHKMTEDLRVRKGTGRNLDDGVRLPSETTNFLSPPAGPPDLVLNGYSRR